MRLDNQKIEELAGKYSLELLLFFGSQVTGKTHKMSDYDFGFISKGGLDYAEKYALEQDLKKAGGIKAEVEAVDLEKISPLMKYRVLRNNKILCEKTGAYGEYFARSLRDYFESERLFELQKKLIDKKIKKIKERV